MTKRLVIGLAAVLAGAGLLTPPLWMLCSPFLAYSVGTSVSGMAGWIAATMAGLTLLFAGVRRLIPVRAAG
jgi:secreted trypsin-like serine protease